MAIPFNRVKTTYDFLDIMPFGKYQGKTISWIIEFDPECLEWYTKKEDLLYLTSKCTDVLEDRLHLLKQIKQEKADEKLKKTLSPPKSKFRDWSVHTDQDDWWDDVPF